MPNGPDRLGAVERGELDAVWDEALPRFAAEAIKLGMKFLPVDEPQLKALEADGLMRAAITDQEYPGLGPGCVDGRFQRLAGLLPRQRAG